MADLERGARRLVTEVWALVDQGVINARSAAADAALDLRDDIDPNWQPERRPVDPLLWPHAPNPNWSKAPDLDDRSAP